MKDGQASVTAQRVAAHRLGFDRVAAPYGTPGDDDALARDVAAEIDVASDVPMAFYLRARTAFFDRLVVRALQQDVAQVVVAAAGYDGRALRYAKLGVGWFEVDHPDTQADKLERLSRLGLAADHVAFVAADFATDDVATLLLAAGLDPEQPTLLLVEGVAAYLERAVLVALLGALRSVAGPGSRLGISLSTASADPDAAARRERFQRGVAALGEAASEPLTVAAAGDLLAETRWRIGADVPGRQEAGDRARSAGFAVLVPDEPGDRDRVPLTAVG